MICLIRQSHKSLLASDTAAYLAITRLADSQQLQAGFDVLQQWEVDWDMEFNPGRCQVLKITKSRIPTPTRSYTIHGQTLRVAFCAKYHGVDISQSWTTHINRITTNANKPLLLEKVPKGTKSIIQGKNIQRHSPTPAGLCCSSLGSLHTRRYMYSKN